MKIESKLITMDDGNYTVVLEIGYVDTNLIEVSIEIFKDNKALCFNHFQKTWDFLSKTVIEMFKQCSYDLKNSLNQTWIDVIEFLEVFITELDFIPELMF